MPEHTALSPQQRQACLILLRDRDVDLGAIGASMEVLEQAGTLNGRAARALQRFFRTEGQEVSARGSVAAVCVQRMRQDQTWQQVFADINDGDMNCVLGTGLMLLSGHTEISDAEREQGMLEGAGLVLAQYMRERAVRALEHGGELDTDAITVLDDVLHDPKEYVTLGEQVVRTLAHLSRQHSAARALFLGLLHDEALEDWKRNRVTSALAAMSPLETLEVEALRLAIRAANDWNMRVYAAQALLLAGSLDAPNTEAFILLLRELQTERLRRDNLAAHAQPNPDSDQAETFRQKDASLAQMKSQEQGSTHTLYGSWMQWMSTLRSRQPLQDVLNLLARIVDDGAIAGDVREDAFRILVESTGNGQGVEEPLLARCLRQSEGDANLNRRVASLLGRREALLPETLAVMVEVITDTGRSPELRAQVADAFSETARLRPAQAKRLFVVVKDVRENARLRGAIVSALNLTKSLRKPMLALLVEWARDTDTAGEVREQAIATLTWRGDVERIGREALLNFLRDASLNEWMRVSVGAKVAQSQALDEEMVQALLGVIASAQQRGMNLYELQIALCQAAQREANVFTVLVAYLRDKKINPGARCELAYTLLAEEGWPAEMCTVLFAMSSDRTVASSVRKSLQEALKRNPLI